MYLLYSSKRKAEGGGQYITVTIFWTPLQAKWNWKLGGGSIYCGNNILHPFPVANGNRKEIQYIVPIIFWTPLSIGYWKAAFGGGGNKTAAIFWIYNRVQNIIWHRYTCCIVLSNATRLPWAFKYVMCVPGTCPGNSKISATDEYQIITSSNFPDNYNR